MLSVKRLRKYWHRATLVVEVTTMPTSDLLKQALSELEKLPLEDQDAIAARWLEEIKDEHVWSSKFAVTTDNQWDHLAASVRRDIANGDTTTLDDFLAEVKPE